MALTMHSDYCKFLEMPVFELIRTVETTLKRGKKIGKRKHK